MKRVLRLLSLGLPLATMPSFAYAYIDPGLISVLLQGFFALIFGSAATYLFAPWRRIKALIGGKSPEPVNPSGTNGDAADADLEESPEKAPR